MNTKKDEVQCALFYLQPIQICQIRKRSVRSGRHYSRLSSYVLFKPMKVLKISGIIITYRYFILLRLTNTPSVRDVILFEDNSL